MSEAFPVGDFIQEELDARGWNTADLAKRMVPQGASAAAIGTAQLCIDLTIAVRDPHLVLDVETARGLARAFSTSPDLWLNLDRAWREHPSAQQYRVSHPENPT